MPVLVDGFCFELMCLESLFVAVVVFIFQRLLSACTVTINRDSGAILRQDVLLEGLLKEDLIVFIVHM